MTWRSVRSPRSWPPPSRRRRRRKPPRRPLLPSDDRAAAFPLPESVAFWEAGKDLAAGSDPARRKDELERVRQVLLGLHERSEGRSRLVTATVAGDYARYASPGRGLDLMGVDLQSW